MADLSEFATKDNADEGKWFPVKVCGKKLPVALLIYGDDSDKVREYTKKKLRKLKIGKNGNADIDEDTLEELMDSNENITCRIGGIVAWDWKKDKSVPDEKVELFGRELKNDVQSFNYLVDKLPAIKEFVLEKSNDRTNFLD